MVVFWQRLPVVMRAILAGAAVAAAGTIPWAFLVEANIRWAPGVPWTVIPAALYLRLFWRYARGYGWPRWTADARRSSARVNDMSQELWGTALVAGWLGLIAISLFQQMMNRLVILPEGQPLQQLGIPPLSLLTLVTMGSLVAGVVEEIAFRGYIQGPIDRRHGPIAGILITATLFAFVHFTHREVTFLVLPYLIGAGVVYGAVAYLTDSIVPGMVLHTVGDVFLGFVAVMSGGSEWRGMAAAQPLVRDTGIDAEFALGVAGFLATAILSVFAFLSLARGRRSLARPADSVVR
jgi:membrane protease YdiL (CAAX protease family)